MYKYTVDTNVRAIVATSFWLLAIILAWLTDTQINHLISLTFSKLGLPGTILGRLFPYSISFISYWALSWSAFDRWLWRLSFIANLIGIPNLEGHWTGTMHRVDYAKGITEDNIPVEMSITQTFTKISIRFWSNRPSDHKAGTPSEATLIGIAVRNRNAIEIIHNFQFFSGKGLCEMTLPGLSSKKISGQYVSTVPRVGSFNMVRS
jgi:hypothetical protein